MENLPNMLMENLPIEVQWNIMKFMRHPIAEVYAQSEDVKLARLGLALYNNDVTTFSDYFFSLQTEFIRDQLEMLQSDGYDVKLIDCLLH